MSIRVLIAAGMNNFFLGMSKDLWAPKAQLVRRGQWDHRERRVLRDPPAPLARQTQLPLVRRQRRHSAAWLYLADRARHFVMASTSAV